MLMELQPVLGYKQKPEWNSSKFLKLCRLKSRLLLVLCRCNGKMRSGHKYQEHVRSELAKHAELESGKAYRAWSEVKMKIETTNDDDEAKSFDYTFDYILAGSGRKRLSEVAKLIGKGERSALSIAQANGYTIAMRDGEQWIDDFPADPIIIIEIMSSSTSGGDKSKRTQVAMACEDAIIDPANHNDPGINYRQVWARMVSQLIVKMPKQKGLLKSSRLALLI